MKLIFLHGAPATGKLTVAKALLRHLPGRLLDNHSAIDLARTVFDFGAPGFWDLAHDVRVSALDAASQHGVALAVMTNCYSDPEDLPQFERIEASMLRNGGELLPVFLHCSEDEIIRRVGNTDRVERQKITSKEGLDRFIASYNISPVPRGSCISLDTTTRSPEETALDIIRHFGLNGLQNSPPSQP